MDAPAGAAVSWKRPVGRCFLPRSGKSWCLPQCCRGQSKASRPPPSGEPVAIARSGRWAIALILKPVPNVSAITADLSLFGKGQRLGVRYPANPQGESDKSDGTRISPSPQFCPIRFRRAIRGNSKNGQKGKPQLCLQIAWRGTSQRIKW
jgi:hypothetical protein